jgi:hypothetical protein
VVQRRLHGSYRVEPRSPCQAAFSGILRGP